MAANRRVQRSAFTLVELLVVIGIIAILVSVLIPVLGNARRSAEKVKCLSNLRQIGNAYKLYQLDNKGAWPAVWHKWQSTNTATNPTGFGDKRWHDFIGKYVVGGMIKKQEVNFNGSQTASLEPQIWTEPIYHSDNALWGCPSWNRIARDAGGAVTGIDSVFHPGYVMNWFPLAPKDNVGGGDWSKTVYIMWSTAADKRGQYFKYTQWKAQAERALVFESIVGHYWNTYSWTWQPDTNTPFPKTANLDFPIDFNRHGRLPTGNRPTDPSLNVLYCDGHASTVNAREAYRAIRFN